MIGACIFIQKKMKFKIRCGLTDPCKTIAKFIVHIVNAADSDVGAVVYCGFIHLPSKQWRMDMGVIMHISAPAYC